MSLTKIWKSSICADKLVYLEKDLEYISWWIFNQYSQYLCRLQVRV